VRDKPRYVGTGPPFTEELDTAHLQILRSLLSVDDGVASVLAALEKTGLDRNTIIIFLTDNGLTLGDHGFGVTKNCPYDACVKVPFIVYAPALFSTRADNNLVANIDIFPTVMEMAQASTSAQVDGVSRFHF
jgi:arylsulfatase A-like enzyme